MDLINNKKLDFIGKMFLGRLPTEDVPLFGRRDDHGGVFKLFEGEVHVAGELGRAKSEGSQPKVERTHDLGHQRFHRREKDHFEGRQID